MKLRHKKLDFLVSQSAITCSKLIIETLEQRCEIYSELTINVNSAHISQLCSSVSVVNFEQVNAGWDVINKII